VEREAYSTGAEPISLGEIYYFHPRPPPACQRHGRRTTGMSADTAMAGRSPACPLSLRGRRGTGGQEETEKKEKSRKSSKSCLTKMTKSRESCLTKTENYCTQSVKNYIPIV